MIKPFYFFIVSTLLLNNSIQAMQAEPITYKTIDGKIIHLEHHHFFSIVQLHGVPIPESGIDTKKPCYWQTDTHLETKENFLNKIVNYNKNNVYIALTELALLKKYEFFHTLAANKIFERSNKSNFNETADEGTLHIRYANELATFARFFKMKRKIIINGTDYTDKQLLMILDDSMLIEEYTKAIQPKAQSILDVVPSTKKNNFLCFIS